MNPFNKLSVKNLRDLSIYLSSSSSNNCINSHGVQQIVGTSNSIEIIQHLESLISDDWTLKQISILLVSMADVKDSEFSPEDMFDLVLSGPDVPGIPIRDTASVMHSLVADACNEILLIGYAIYNGKKLFQPIAERMKSVPELKVTFCLNIARAQHDTSLDSEIIKRFMKEFYDKHWPWATKPTVYYDPRSLSIGPSERSNLHAKCVIVDRKVALITSANFTEAAHYRNIEAGVVLRYEPFVKRIAMYFDGLSKSVFKEC